MKKLKTLSLTRLTVLAFGQHMKSIYEGLSLTGEGAITDEVLINYIDTLKSKMVDYDRGTLVITKSDQTSKIVAANKERDNAVSAATRMLKVYELSTETSQQLAFESLNTLFNAYKGIQSWDFAEETNGIDNLIDDLNDPKYSSHISTLNMDAYVLRLKTANDTFKALFKSRTLEVALKEVFDTKAMRKDIKTVYEDMVYYVFAMAKALDTEQYNNSLNHINTVRKYYADLMARHKGKTTPVVNTTETPTPSLN